MEMIANNVLIIGTGYHARRIYIPYVCQEKKTLQINNIIGLDLISQKIIIDEYLKENSYNLVQMSYIDDKNKDNIQYLEKIINKMVLEFGINSVIISTEPLYHFIYAKIALNNNLSILLDKPITLEKDIVIDSTKSQKIIENYEYLCKRFKELSKKNINVQFDIMAQRRYHKGYILVGKKIKEIMKQVNCPVTHINTFHNDGMWRLPDEIIDFNYHPYNQGYGKLGHSGFHTIDIATSFIKNTSIKNKKINTAKLFSTAVFPQDLYAQFNYQDYENIFPGFTRKSKYSQEEFLNKSKGCGDVDVSGIIKFYNSKGVQSMFSLNLGHNGFSQRGWESSVGKDLYKGNGRVRQEFMMIEQGPFQSIFIETFQSKEINKKNKNLYSFGGEQHYEIHIFRNAVLDNNWKNYEKITSQILYDSTGKGYSRGHNEEARRNGIQLFFKNLSENNHYSESLSNILDHNFSVYTFANLCRSIALQREKKNPIIEYNLNKEG